MFPNISHALVDFWMECPPSHLILGAMKNIGSVFHQIKSQVRRRTLHLKISKT